MSKKTVVPVYGRDVTRLENGALVVSRCCPDLRWPYTEEEVIPNYLGQVDHSLKMKKKAARKAKQEAEQELNHLVREVLVKKKKTLIVALQGRDGAGKTGARIALSEALDNDAKLFQAICIGPPSEDERNHPYLWRFMTGERMPKFGEVRVFDRCWAERLLVEPVMGFASKSEVRASYAEIRSFEWLLGAQGAVLVKVWMDITKDEQKRRFEDRAREKPWKLSESDEIARSHWDDYTKYANEMFHRTGTDFAPWYIISSENKQYSRVAMLQVINDSIKAACR